MCNMQIEPGADPGFSEGRVRIRGDRVLSFIVANFNKQIIVVK